MDPLAVHLAWSGPRQRLRAGEGPVVIEALVYRFFHQNGPYPGLRVRLPDQGGGGRVAGPRPA